MLTNQAPLSQHGEYLEQFTSKQDHNQSVALEKSNRNVMHQRLDNQGQSITSQHLNATLPGSQGHSLSVQQPKLSA
jgi:hypothetical protein